MKLVKISSLGCPSCIIMNNVINKLKNDYDFLYEEYDYDFDDIKRFNVGKILPVIILYDDLDNELIRFNGEHKKEELQKVLEGVI